MTVESAKNSILGKNNLFKAMYKLYKHKILFLMIKDNVWLFFS